MKRIYAIDWKAMHPDGMPTATDQYYVEVANKVLNILKMLIPLRTIHMFDFLNENELMELAASVTLKTHIEDSLILDGITLPDSLPILIKGRVLLTKPGADGWDNPLRIIGNGGIITTDGVLGHLSEGIRAQVVSSTADVLYIPAKKLKELFASHIEIPLTLIDNLKKAVATYQNLWLSM